MTQKLEGPKQKPEPSFATLIPGRRSKPFLHGPDRPTNYYAGLTPDGDRLVQTSEKAQDVEGGKRPPGPDSADRLEAVAGTDGPSLDGSTTETSKQREDGAVEAHRTPPKEDHRVASKSEDRNPNGERERTDAQEIRDGRNINREFQDAALEVTRPPAGDHHEVDVHKHSIHHEKLGRMMSESVWAIDGGIYFGFQCVPPLMRTVL